MDRFPASSLRRVTPIQRNCLPQSQDADGPGIESTRPPPARRRSSTDCEVLYRTYPMSSVHLPQVASMELPSQMTVVTSAAPGGPEVLHTARAAVPRPGRGEVLVRVAAAGVNFPDLLQRGGDYPPPPGVTPVLGLEISGVVAALGEGVDAFGVGDAVCAWVIGGGDAKDCGGQVALRPPVPEGLSATKARAVPHNCGTRRTHSDERGRVPGREP